MANSRTRKKSKQVYFKKDYAPARAAALRSRKTSTRVRAQFVRKISVASQKVSTYTQNKRQKRATIANTNKTIRTVNPRSRNRRHKVGAMTWREVTLLSSIGVCAFMIVFTFIYGNIFDPVKRSENQLEKLANTYYIEYYYPRILGKYLYQPEEVLADYTATGLPSVRLRQLLLANDGKYADFASSISNNYYHCNINNTSVRYYPVAPYGPRDYTVTYTTDCEKVGKS